MILLSAASFQTIIMGIGAICIFALFLYLLWDFIKSAVREGTKEAIYAALIETGIAKPKE